MRQIAKNACALINTNKVNFGDQKRFLIYCADEVKRWRPEVLDTSTAHLKEEKFLLCLSVYISITFGKKYKKT